VRLRFGFSGSALRELGGVELLLDLLGFLLQLRQLGLQLRQLRRWLPFLVISLHTRTQLILATSLMVIEVLPDIFELMVVFSDMFN
jgi:hypothetical protein